MPPSPVSICPWPLPPFEVIAGAGAAAAASRMIPFLTAMMIPMAAQPAEPVPWTPATVSCPMPLTPLQALLLPVWHPGLCHACPPWMWLSTPASACMALWHAPCPPQMPATLPLTPWRTTEATCLSSCQGFPDLQHTLQRDTLNQIDYTCLCPTAWHCWDTLNQCRCPSCACPCLHEHSLPVLHHPDGQALWKVSELERRHHMLSTELET